MICQALSALNETGGVQIYQASFEILESGALTRPRCHTSNAEVFIDVCLKAPDGPVFTAVGDEQSPWVPGEAGIFDGSFEHVMANKAIGDPAVVLRLVVRHPHLPCVGSFETCGVRGYVGTARRWLKRMFSAPPSDYGMNDDLS